MQLACRKDIIGAVGRILEDSYISTYELPGGFQAPFEDPNLHVETSSKGIQSSIQREGRNEYLVSALKSFNELLTPYLLSYPVF